MAAIGKIRSWGPWLVGIIALALFGFIAGDMWRSCETTSNMSRQQVGEVLGEKLNYQDYSEMVEEYQESSKLIKEILSKIGDSRAEVINDDQDADNADMISDQVWDMYVQNVVMAEEAEKLGLTVTDQELASVLEKGTNPVFNQSFFLIYPYFDQMRRQLKAQPLFFNQEGRFDYQEVKKLAELLKSNENNPQLAGLSQRFEKYWLSVEKELRLLLLIEKYQGLLAACNLSNTVAAKASFEANHTLSEVALAFYPYSSINDNAVSVSDADLQKKYEEKKESFKLYTEMRNINYVSYQVVPSEADKNALVKTLAEATEALEKDSLKAADVVRKYRSLVTYNGYPVSSKYLEELLPGINAVLDSMQIGDVNDFQSLIPASANHSASTAMGVVKLMGKPVVVDSIQVRTIYAPNEKTADSIMQVINGGEDFDSLSIKLYNAAAKKQWITVDGLFNKTMAPDIKKYWDEFLTLQAGETRVIKDLQNPNSRFIVQAIDVKAAKQLYDLAIVVSELKPSNDTFRDSYNKFSQFVANNQSFDKLSKNAAKNNYQVSPDIEINSAAHNIAGIPGTKEAIKWAFQAKEGAVSPAYERCGNNDMFVAVVLKKINPVGYRDLASVKEQLRAEVLKDKKFEYAKKKLNGVTSIEAAVAADAAVQVDTIGGVKFNQPTPLGKMGNYRESTLSGAIAATPVNAFSKQVVKGEYGAYVFQVLNRTEAAGEFNDAAEQKQLRYMQSRITSLAFSELRNKAEVVDNRYLFR